MGDTMQMELMIGGKRIALQEAPRARGRKLPNHLPPNKGLMRIDEVAEYLSIGTTKVTELIEAGRLEIKVISTREDPVRRHTRVKTESVKRYVEGADVL